jgi:hypothetical protein
MCAQERGHSLTVTRRPFVQGIAVAGAALVEGKFNQAAAQAMVHIHRCIWANCYIQPSDWPTNRRTSVGVWDLAVAPKLYRSSPGISAQTGLNQ